MLTEESAPTPVGPVLKVAVLSPLRQCFDYQPPEGVDPAGLRAGIRVQVPFGPQTLVGFLLGIGPTSLDSSQLKPALDLLDSSPLLSAEDCAVLSWASRYYHHPIGEVYAAAFPTLLRQGQPAEPERRLCLTGAGAGVALASKPKPKLSAQQARLLAALQERGGIAFHELDGLGRAWRRTAQALIDKGWACERETEIRMPTHQPCAVSPHILNAAQQAALDAVLAALGGYRAFLLEGVTGSGKTEVYLRLVEEVLAQGRQAMVLVPEINLTPQLEARFRARFSAPLVVFHSSLSDAERCRAWLAMRHGTASILLGTRSAVFTPLARPGLIILDEEHDTSFKQQDGFRFSARDVAVVRARQLHVPILMGSATPSLESLHNVQRGRYARLALPERTGLAKPPRFGLIDIRNQRLNEGLSPTLQGQIAAALARGEQALLFLNRRGFAPTVICHACGWVAECPRCDARLVLHAGERHWRCHHCGFEQAALRDCPKCRTADLRPLGLGTERVEQALAKLFPKARTLRIDRDSTRLKGSLDGMLDLIHAGQVDILLGTQMLAKGHHFPNVTLVGILDVDGGLFSLDYRASERIAQTILQVAGRAGREERPGLVLLQTRQPDHPLLRTLIREGYGAFAEAALAERREAELPPYTHQALWRAEAPDEAKPARLLARLGELAAAHTEVLALGPAPAPLPRMDGRWRSQLLLQAAERKPLHATVEHLARLLPKLPEARGVRWSVDIDPVDLY
ncbi:MAG: primosomal protein N' [Candidatus Methylumidiphilus sp.]